MLKTTASQEPDNLIVGHEVPSLIQGLVLEAGQGVLEKGSVLGVITKSKKGKLCNSTNEDGSEAAKFILSKRVDTSSGDVITIAYKSGIFNKDKLIFGGNDSAEDHRTKLRDLDIHIRETI